MSDEPVFVAYGKTQVWWYPAPREGETVPDYPPQELGGIVTDMQIEVEPEEVPDWVTRLASSKGDAPFEITIGDEDVL